eukprot:gene11753-5091_t
MLRFLKSIHNGVKKHFEYNNPLYYQKNSKIFADDVTKLNNTSINKLFTPKDEEELQNIIKLAKMKGKKISIRGQSHTMGGHSLSQNCYLIDMKYMKTMKYDEKKKVLIAEPGATWGDAIRFLNNFGQSPEIMQSYCSFSIGGTISVNAHGITSDNSMIESIISFRMINSDGEIIECDRNNNAELFSLAIGGFGLFGIITNVKLNVVPNVKISMESLETPVKDFKEIYLDLLKNDNIEVKISRINISNFENIYIYLFMKNNDHETVANLDKIERRLSIPSKFMYKWVGNVKIFQKIRFFVESFVESPLDWNSTQTDRNLLMYESAKPITYLYSPLIEIDDTFILQEYFIPFQKFDDFMKKMKTVLLKKFEKISLLNITIRCVKKDTSSFLSYSPENSFAFVLYFRIQRTEKGEMELKSVHEKLVSIIKEMNGRFYLPYRHHYSNEDLSTSYPMIDQFFQLKNQYDKDHLFSNLWYEKYGSNYYKEPIPKISNDSQRKDETGTYVIPKMDIHRSTSYQKIFSDESLKIKFHQFLTTVFNVVPPKYLFGFYSKATWNPKNKTDLDVYKEVQDRINNLSKFQLILKNMKSLKQLITQKIELTREYHSVMTMIGRIGTIDNFVCIGDSGKLIPNFKRILKIKGDVYVMHDQQRFLDKIEKGTFFDKSKFIEFDLENIKENYEIPKNTIDLVTINQGLHHIPVDQLPKFLNFVFKILRKNGLFIVREHDATEEMIPLVDVAHSTFNAVTGVSIENEKTEIRAFRTIKQWKEILTNHGFEDLHVMELQEDDPTVDFMLCFQKKLFKNETTIPRIKDDNFSSEFEIEIKSLKKSFEDKGNQLNLSNPSSCHYRLPEWMLVRVTEEFGKFMNKEVFFYFPYLKYIALYWKVYFQEFKVVRKNYDFKTAVLGYGPMMNLFIGIVFSTAFLQFWIISAPIRLLNSLGNPGSGSIEQMIISSKREIDFKSIDKKMKILEMKKLNTQILYLLEVQRHLPFNQICFKLAELQDVAIIEIGGISENIIQLELVLSERMLLNEIQIESFQKLFEFKYPTEENVIHISCSVKVKHLIELIKQCEQIDGIQIKQIFDFLFK